MWISILGGLGGSGEASVSNLKAGSRSLWVDCSRTKGLHAGLRAKVAGRDDLEEFAGCEGRVGSEDCVDKERCQVSCPAAVLRAHPQ